MTEKSSRRSSRGRGRCRCEGGAAPGPANSGVTGWAMADVGDAGLVAAAVWGVCFELGFGLVGSGSFARPSLAGWGSRSSFGEPLSSHSAGLAGWRRRYGQPLATMTNIDR